MLIGQVIDNPVGKSDVAANRVAVTWPSPCAPIQLKCALGVSVLQIEM